MDCLNARKEANAELKGIIGTGGNVVFPQPDSSACSPPYVACRVLVK